MNTELLFKDILDYFHTKRFGRRIKVEILENIMYMTPYDPLSMTLRFQLHGNTIIEMGDWITDHEDVADIRNPNCYEEIFNYIKERINAKNAKK